MCAGRVGEDGMSTIKAIMAYECPSCKALKESSYDAAWCCPVLKVDAWACSICGEIYRTKLQAQDCSRKHVVGHCESCGDALYSEPSRGYSCKNAHCQMFMRTCRLKDTSIETANHDRLPVSMFANESRSGAIGCVV